MVLGGFKMVLWWPWVVVALVLKVALKSIVVDTRVFRMVWNG